MFFMREMAAKEKKRKKSSQKKKQVSRGILGLEYLPQQLRDWRTQKNINWGGYGVCKSWRSVSKQCNSNNGSMPQLQLSCAIHSWIQVREHAKSHPHHHFLKTPFLPVGFYTSTCRDWCVNPHLFLSKSTSSTQDEIYIPPWGVMRTTGLSRPALLFLRPPQHQDPVRVECLDDTLTDPYGSAKQSIIFTNFIRFESKFYALSLQGALAVVEVDDSSFKITGVGKNRAVPSLPSRRFIEYLIESNGEILLVFLIISRKSTSKIDYVEVVKLDLVTLSWVKMESLGDRALFLAGTNHCLSVNTKQVGYKSNHVYFTHEGIDCWKEFDLESRSISSCCNFH